MAFIRSNMISRSGYSGFGGIWDTITGAAGGVVNWWDTQQRGIGAQQQSAADYQAALAAQQGPGIGTVLLIGGGALVMFALMKKKKRHERESIGSNAPSVASVAKTAGEP